MKQMRAPASIQQGFTLLEVMVALMIMSIVAVALTPVWVEEYNEKRASLVIEETQTILDAARVYRTINGTWPGGATCLTAISEMKSTTPPLLAGVNNINRFNEPLSTSCTTQTFSIDQTLITDFDGVVANGLPSTEIFSTPANSIRTTIGVPGSEPALDGKLSRIATGNAEMNRMQTTLLLGGNNITEVSHIDAQTLNVAGQATTGGLRVLNETRTDTLIVDQGSFFAGPTTHAADVAFHSSVDLLGSVRLHQVVGEGTWCPSIGAIARTHSGATVSCQYNVWTSNAGGGTESALLYGGMFATLGYCAMANRITGGCSCPAGYDASLKLIVGSAALYECSKIP